MTLHYQLTLDDWTEAGRASRGQNKRWGVLILAGLCIFFGILLLMTGSNPSSYGIALLGILVGVFVLVLGLMLPRFAWRRALLNNPDTTQPYTLQWEGDVLSFQRPNIETRVSRGKYTHARETENLFVLYWSPLVFQIVPKRAFANEADMERFRLWTSTLGQAATGQPPIPNPG